MWDTLRNVWLVIRHKAVVVPIMEDSDTCLAVIRLDGNLVDTIRVMSFVEVPDTYCVQLAKIIHWASRRPRFFWKADTLGSQVMEASEAALREG